MVRRRNEKRKTFTTESPKDGVQDEETERTALQEWKQKVEPAAVEAAMSRERFDFILNRMKLTLNFLQKETRWKYFCDFFGFPRHPNSSSKQGPT
jgi:hypothetical protein